GCRCASDHLPFKGRERVGVSLANCLRCFAAAAVKGSSLHRLPIPFGALNHEARAVLRCRDAEGDGGPSRLQRSAHTTWRRVVTGPVVPSSDTLPCLGRM